MAMMIATNAIPKQASAMMELMKFMNLEFSNTEGHQRDDVPLSLRIDFEKIKAQMDNLTPDGKIKKLVRQNGEGEVVSKEALMSIKYLGFIKGQDEPYDSSDLLGTQYLFDQEELISGLEVAIQSMQKHEISIFWIHPDHAHSELGCATLVPPNTEVIFIVHLFDFQNNYITDLFVDLDEQFNFVHTIKRNVRSIFYRVKNNLCDFGTALSNYIYLVETCERKFRNLWLLVDENDRRDAEVQRLLSKVYHNIAVCSIKENMIKQALEYCKLVTDKTAMTYYIYGKALMKVTEFNLALEKFHKALKWSPKNPTIVQEIQLTNELYTEHVGLENRLLLNCTGIDKSNDIKKYQMYEKFVREMCESFLSNEIILRQRLPQDLTPEAIRIILEHARDMGISLKSYMRYNGIINYYLRK